MFAVLAVQLVLCLALILPVHRREDFEHVAPTEVRSISFSCQYDTLRNMHWLLLTRHYLSSEKKKKQVVWVRYGGYTVVLPSFIGDNYSQFWESLSSNQDLLKLAKQFPPWTAWWPSNQTWRVGLSKLDQIPVGKRVHH